MQNIEISSIGLTGNLSASWRRLLLKVSLLGEIRIQSKMQVGFIGLSECDDHGDLNARLVNIESTVGRIEAKLDDLLQIQISGSTPPPWFRDSLCNIQSEMQNVLLKNRVLSQENDIVRDELHAMSEDAVKFLSGLQQKLTPKERDIFFQCIVTNEVNGKRRLLTYSEIGGNLGITKQAVQKRLRALESRNKQVGIFIASVRHPEKPRSFSALSPSDRRKHGIEESYNQT